MDTIWLAEAYPWWRKHGMEARSSTVVSALMARETRAADDRLGDHLAVHPPPGAGRDGRAGRPGGRRARALPARVRDVEDLPEQREAWQTRSCRRSAPMRDAVEITRGVLGGDAFDYDGKVFSASVPALQDGGGHAARGPARLRGRDGAEDAGARGRDRRRLPDAVDHDARLRALHARERRPRHRHRLHHRRLDRRGSRRGPGRRARDRRACTSRTRCRTSRARPTRCSTSRGSSRRRSGRSRRRWSAAAGSRRRSW